MCQSVSQSVSQPFRAVDTVAPFTWSIKLNVLTTCITLSTVWNSETVLLVTYDLRPIWLPSRLRTPLDACMFAFKYWPLIGRHYTANGTCNLTQKQSLFLGQIHVLIALAQKIKRLRRDRRYVEVSGETLQVSRAGCFKARKNFNFLGQF